MRVTVFGATGPIGREFLRAAAAGGVSTHAFVRDPARLAGAPATATTVGDVFDAERVRTAVAGSDAVLVAFGLRNDRRTPLYSRGTRTVVDAMHAGGVSRLLVLSEASYGEHVTGPVDRLITGAYGLVNGPALAERRRQDAIVADSELDWTIVRGRVIADRPSQGPIPVHLTPQSPVTARTPRVDLARFLLGIITDTTTYGRPVYP